MEETKNIKSRVMWREQKKRKEKQIEQKRKKERNQENRINEN